MADQESLLLIDYENRHHIDLSLIDKSYRVVFFVGVLQNEAKLKRKLENENRLVRIDYLKVEGVGKNALDFHIAFKLGQVYETARDTSCIILSADKGFDPLLQHLNAIGLRCRRIETLLELSSNQPVPNLELTVCMRCRKASTIEHNGGRWCTNCGRFAIPPDIEITSSLIERLNGQKTEVYATSSCVACNVSIDTGDGIYDDGEWTCWACAGV